MHPVIWQILGAFLFAVAMVKDKAVLKRNGATPRDYTSVVFIWLVVFSGLTATVTFKADWEKLANPNYYLAFLFLILLAFLWNKLFYYFQDREQLQDFEVMNLVVPAVTALLAGLVFIEERSSVVVVAATICFLALFVVRLERHHLKFNAYSGLMIVMIFAMAGEALLRKVSLSVFDPATLYFLRTFGVLILMFMFYTPKLKRVPLNVWWDGAISSFLGAMAMIIMFYGYRDLGVVLTTLIFVLSPMIVYFLDAMILREKIAKKNLVASTVILLAVSFAAIYG